MNDETDIQCALLDAIANTAPLFVQETNRDPSRIQAFDTLATYILNALKEISQQLNINQNLWSTTKSTAGNPKIMVLDLCAFTNPQVKHKLMLSSIHGYGYHHIGYEGNSFTININDHKSTIESLKQLIKQSD